MNARGLSSRCNTSKRLALTFVALNWGGLMWKIQGPVVQNGGQLLTVVTDKVGQSDSCNLELITNQLFPKCGEEFYTDGPRLVDEYANTGKCLLSGSADQYTSNAN